MRYFIYARRSSEDKSKQIQSIPNQLEWAERMRDEHGLEIIDTFTDTKTGTKPGREAFNAMVEAIEASPEPVGILCWKVNRLARNPIDEGIIKYAFMRGKIKHIFGSDRQFKEGESQILMGVEFGSATQYSIDLSHDVKRGMARKLEQGWMPGWAPLGYLNDPHGLKGTKRIYRDKKSWDKLRRLWDFLLTG
ncbi:MAG: site-specific recombinase [Desulfovibrionales bacterium]|nr:site-specific recombinase [Desulfovibrionales bacterium]